MRTLSLIWIFRDYLVFVRIRGSLAAELSSAVLAMVGLFVWVPFSFHYMPLSAIEYMCPRRSKIILDNNDLILTWQGLS